MRWLQQRRKLYRIRDDARHGILNAGAGYLTRTIFLVSVPFIPESR
jgi:hypothetical protein